MGKLSETSREMRAGSNTDDLQTRANRACAGSLPKKQIPLIVLESCIRM